MPYDDVEANAVSSGAIEEKDDKLWTACLWTGNVLSEIILPHSFYPFLFFLASYAYLSSFFTFVYSRMWRIYYAGGKYSAKVAKGTCGYRLDLTQGWQMIFHRVSRQIVVRLTEDLVRLNVVLNLLIILNLSSKFVKRNHGCFFIILFILLLIFAEICSPFVNESEVN